jgi:two-component system, OmpR family, phosphate regulon response regulator PhoB
MQVSKVLVVDADRAVRDALVTCLRFVGLEAHGAEDAVAARSWLSSADADVMVLSDQLPDGSPGELFAGRGGSARAAIVMMANGATNSAAAGRLTNYRADATLLRPISVGRVVEQVETLLRARRSSDVTVRFVFGALSLDLAGSSLEHRGDKVNLGRTEARLLRFFMSFPDRVFSRSQLLERLWPSSVRVEERTVDVHIRRLRLSLETLGCADYVQTVRGSGYRFSALPQ